MMVRGKAWKFGDDVDTDQIYPGAYLPLTDINEMAKHAMEGVPGKEDFAQMVGKGDVMIAGKNFGCGSSREHAPVAIRGAGIDVIIAKSYARIFYRNAVNIGFPILELSEVDEMDEGDELEVNLETGDIKDFTKGREFKARPVSGLEFEIMEAGGLLNYLKKKG